MIMPMPQGVIDIYASIVEKIMRERSPDQTILHPDHGPYLEKWEIYRSDGFVGYVHRFLRSDYDVELHDHQWDNTSIIVSGGYTEQVIEDGKLVAHWRPPGAVINRQAAQAHRIILLNEEPSVSIFTHGPKTRDWGFITNDGWVFWQDFIKQSGMTVI